MKKLIALLTMGVILTFSNSGNAVTFNRGNDCSGVFGRGFSNCITPEGYKSIIKFEEDLTVSEISSNFPSIDGSEFVLMGNNSGLWTYIPNNAEDPQGIQGWVAKAGNGFNYYTSNDTTNLLGFWNTPSGKDLSHLTLYGVENTQTSPPPNTKSIFEPSLLQGLIVFTLISFIRGRFTDD